MKQTYPFMLPILILLTACTQKSDLIPKLKLGQPENEWRSAVSALASNNVLDRRTGFGDTSYRYHWKIGDMPYDVDVTFNDDVIQRGSLRTVSYFFGTEKCDVERKSIAGLGDFLEGGDGTLPTHLCRKGNADKLQSYLERKYGKPDSVTVMESQARYGTYKDTSYWYSGSGYTLKLSKGELHKPTTSFSSYYYTNPELTFYQKGYSKTLETTVEQMRKALRPADLVSIDFNVIREASVRNPNGLSYPALKVVADMPVATSALETRPITAVRGRLELTDRFGESLYVFPDFEYVPEKPIRYSRYSYTATSGDRYGKTWTLFMINRPDIAKLRDAFIIGKEIKATFTPDAISFEDGSILK